MFKFSTPTRLAIYIKGLPISIKVRSKEIKKGPKFGVPSNILQSFVKTHGLGEKDLFKKTDKGEFYFIKTHEKKILIKDLLIDILPKAIQSINWKKSMKWSTHNLIYGEGL